jgi:hypothetical protein
MKKRKVGKVVNMYDKNCLKINKEINNDYFFEIGEQITTDVAEAVAIMMGDKELINSDMWNIDIDSDLDVSCISPEKSLYWLTGGDYEWKTLNHYNLSWSECYLDFQEEFGLIIVSIVKSSKNLKEIRDKFLKHLSLPILYDFAISKGLAN